MLSLNENPINITIFPDNTSQCWHIEGLTARNPARIEWKFEHEGEIAHLVQLKLLLDIEKIPTFLTLPYLPYGRQDKPVSNDNTFALHAFAFVINSLNFDSVTIIDPHSDIALYLIRRSSARYPINEVVAVFDYVSADIICYPDKGARRKYQSLYDIPYITGEKQRNQETGKIESLELVGNCKDKNILIVDDICDYGTTFIKLADKLYEAGAKEVSLFVTHGLFSGGLDLLKAAKIRYIFTKEGQQYA